MSEYKNFKTTIGKDGIAVFTWNMDGQSMNLITPQVMDEMEAIIDQVTADEAIKGAVIASGKKDFTGGADITMLAGIRSVLDKQKNGNPEKTQQKLLDASSRLSAIYRKLETCGKPFVAAIDGTCMGGGTELALACHARIAGEKAKIGLPEVKIGIFPGAGGTQRVIRMVKDQQAAMQFLLQGRTLDGSKAKAIGLFDEVVPSRSVVSAAKAMLKAGIDPEKPWDKKGYRLEGAQKIMSPAGFQFWPAANAIYRKETFDNYPGARGIMHAVVEGLQLPMDQALKVESRYFAHVLQTPEAAAMIRSLFVSMQELNKGARRPAGVPTAKFRKIGVIGAGFMGAGIAYVTAKAGIDVVLIDQSQEAADKGKSYSEELMKKAMSRGRATQAETDALRARITPTTNYADLKGCNLVIEAVFEDRGVKAAAFEQVEAHLGKAAIFASNTSTLPITSLAESYSDQASFIGIHFFSPVDKMLLVEIILGDKTEDKALATALDYVRAIKKTPIVVNDSRGFFANRCVTAYLLEGHLMLSEGVPAAMIENAARMAGMPVGPLSLNDEVGVDLGWKILKATEADLGAKAINPAQKALLEEMVVRRERLGRKNSKGFYDYQGRNKALWPGLADLVEPKPAEQFDVAELKHRFLAVQALEAARTMEEGVVTDPREADVGSILGFGFAPYTGGTLSYIDQMGAEAFVKLCKGLQKTHGDRFKPNKLLGEMAKNGETFYGRFGKSAKKAGSKRRKAA
jgi:3-hydroxyacyl-CoA dehydrogenase/enoyl-CoA hydratase/3-hydroxybutyryl-CoA epimerase